MVEISRQKKINFLFILMWIFAFTHFFVQYFDFVKMHPTMPSEYLFVSNSINKFVEVTTGDKQLLKLSKTFSIFIFSIFSKFI